ncbi:MAG TPA: hypothetical protein VF616_02665 [Duganella sp.]|uniref:hypothetical protein n=1 Tax=Duganella sp. TaxID=1904440 RepID=UPI002ED6B446
MRASLKPVGGMIVAAAVSVALAAPAMAQEATSVAPSSHSVAEADATLARVATEREAVNAEYAANETVCYNKFFVNNCLDKAKEKRRVELANLRALEVEAEHFKRAASVARRDADLAERARKDDEELARREALPPKPVKDVDNAPPPAPPKGRRIAEREADHAARMKREAATTAANADKRAANAARYEQKKIDAERRQADVAKRVAETERKRAAKVEEEKKKAAAAAAAAAAAVKK